MKTSEIIKQRKQLTELLKNTDYYVTLISNDNFILCKEMNGNVIILSNQLKFNAMKQMIEGLI